MGANGHGSWASMSPASVIVGLAAAPLWTAQCAYFIAMAGKYSSLSGENNDDVVTKFFGIFFFFFQLCKFVTLDTIGCQKTFFIYYE